MWCLQSSQPATNPDESATLPLSSRLSRLPRLAVGLAVGRAVGPERTRISYRAAPNRSTCAAFRRESRMKLTEPNEFNRKSGGAKWRDLRFFSEISSSSAVSSARHLPSTR